MKLPTLTKEEQLALMNAMTNSFGSCTCRPVMGRIMFCDGHRFLSETETYGTEHSLISRVERMVYVRRMATFWTTPEFGRPFQLEPGPMLEPDPLPPDLFGPEPSKTAVPESPSEGDDNQTLPW